MEPTYVSILSKLHVLVEVISKKITIEPGVKLPIKTAFDDKTNTCFGLSFMQV